jgi:hypothetical protein
MANFPFQPQMMQQQQQYFAMQPPPQLPQQSQLNTQYQEFLARTQQQLPQLPLNLTTPAALAQPPNFFKPPTQTTVNPVSIFNPTGTAATNPDGFDSLVQQTIANHMNQQQQQQQSYHGHSHDHSGHGHSH